MSINDNETNKKLNDSCFSLDELELEDKNHAKNPDEIVDEYQNVLNNFNDEEYQKNMEEIDNFIRGVKKDEKEYNDNLHFYNDYIQEKELEMKGSVHKLNEDIQNINICFENVVNDINERLK